MRFLRNFQQMQWEKTTPSIDSYADMASNMCSSSVHSACSTDMDVAKSPQKALTDICKKHYRFSTAYMVRPLDSAQNWRKWFRSLDQKQTSLLVCPIDCILGQGHDSSAEWHNFWFQPTLYEAHVSKWSIFTAKLLILFSAGYILIIINITLKQIRWLRSIFLQDILYFEVYYFDWPAKGF